jgi:hypothetical protein
LITFAKSHVNFNKKENKKILKGLGSDGRHGIFSLSLFPHAPKDPALSSDSGTFLLVLAQALSGAL